MVPLPAPATVPPPAPPPPAAVGSRPRRRPNALLYGVVVVALFGLVGGAAVLLSGGHPAATGPAASSHGPGVPANGRDALQGAVQRTETGSMRADIHLTQTFTASGPGGIDLGTLNGGEISLTIHIDQENANRSELHETVSALGVHQTVIAMLYDGTVYLSSDNGASYQTANVGAATNHQLSPKSPLAYLDMVSEVTQTGGVEVNGAQATSFHATLDTGKVDAFLRQGLAAANDPVLDQVANNMGLTNGSLDAVVDTQDNLLSETGSIDAAMDLGALSPRDAGSTLNMHEGISGAFSDYGAAITVTPPKDVNVTGPSNLT